MSDIRLPSEVVRLLKAAKVDHVDMYAGRRVRNGAGKVHYRSSNGNGDHAGAAADSASGKLKAVGARKKRAKAAQTSSPPDAGDE